MIAPAHARSRTRIVRTHEPWVPKPYMERAVKHLIESHSAALFLDPGLGKTAIDLAAFMILQKMGLAEKMLVVAPLRVCQLVWEQEGRKWTQFRRLRFSLLHGRKKEKALAADADVYLINPEGIAWLAQQFFGRAEIPWDVITVDELTKFKNARAARSKKLRKLARMADYVWGLTGTPAPNGYMDLFGQFLLLDDGAALGKYITVFRDRYFNQGYTGFDYELKPDGAAAIEEKIAPYVLRMSADDYLSLPPLIDNRIKIVLPPKARRQYEEMKKDTLLSLPEGVVTAANAGAVYSKLAQMANGAVYINEGEYVEIHDEKLNALEDLVEELAGQPLLVGYEFQHDLDRLKNRFGRDVPSLAGLSHKRVMEMEAAWNNGEIPLMFGHPASMGHGLNLQGHGAAHICWFSKPWDLELYDQFIRRILRQGTTAQRIMNHSLCVVDSLDELKEERLEEKDVTQQGLLNALKAVLQDEPAPTPNGEDEDMGVKKLGFKGGNAKGAAPAAAAERPRVQPKGWGAPPPDDDGEEQEEEEEEEEEQRPAKRTARAPAASTASGKRPAGWGPPEGEDDGDEQQEQIRSKIKAPAQRELDEEEEEDDEPPPSAKALEAFKNAGVQGLGDDDGEEEEEEEEEQPKPAKPTKPKRPAKHASTGTQEVPQEDLPPAAKTGRRTAAEAQQEIAAHHAAVSDGADPRTLATLFETMAKLLRGE